MKVSPVDLNLLAVLDAILQTRSVSRAAEQVGISKTAMSHALARLREQIGDPVLVRAGQEWLRSVLPASCGKVTRGRRAS